MKKLKLEHLEIDSFAIAAEDAYPGTARAMSEGVSILNALCVDSAACLDSWACPSEDRHACLPENVPGDGKKKGRKPPRPQGPQPGHPPM